MGRLTKAGLQYFNIDVDIFQDKKVRRLSRKYDRGFEIYVFILSCIYRDKGYYLEFDDDSYFDVADQLRLEEEDVRGVINYALEIGLFSSDLFGRNKILTSKGVQLRYIDVIKSLKRKVSIDKDLSLLPPDEPAEKPKHSEETPINPEEIRIDSEKTPENSEKNGISSDRQNRQNRIDRIEGNKKNISLSEEIGAISAQEKKEIFEIFLFEKNVYPSQEFEKFTNHYSAVDWVNGKGQKITNKVAQAKIWKCEPVIPLQQVHKIKMIYAACQGVGDPMILLSGFVSIESGVINIRDSGFRDYLESAIKSEAIRGVVQTVIESNKLTYKQK